MENQTSSINEAALDNPRGDEYK